MTPFPHVSSKTGRTQANAPVEPAGLEGDPAARQEVETALMTPVDTQAAKALEYIET